MDEEKRSSERYSVEMEGENGDQKLWNLVGNGGEWREKKGGLCKFSRVVSWKEKRRGESGGVEREREYGSPESFNEIQSSRLDLRR